MGEITRRNPDLYAAVRALVCAAAQALTDDSAGGQSPVFQVGWPRWHQDGLGRFVMNAERLYLRLEGQVLARLAEYPTALAALESDPIIAPQLGQVVGTMLGQIIMTAPMILQSAVTAAVDLPVSLAVNEGKLDAFYTELEAYLYSSTIQVTTLTPLLGLGGYPRGSVTMSPETVLAQLDEPEIERCLSVGAPNTFGPFFANDPPLWGVRTTEIVPKLVGSTASPGIAEFEAFIARGDAERDLVIATLRLHKHGRVVPLATLRFPSPHPGIGSGTSVAILGSGQHMFVTYIISEEESPSIARLATTLGSKAVISNSSLQNAMRRFSYAGDRMRDEDRLVDLLIAAESLFLGGSRDTEVRYRLSLYAAKLLGNSAETRRDIARTMRSAYDVRSDVVHGRQPEARSLGTIEDRPRTLAEFTDMVEDIVRRGVLRLSDLAHVAWPGRQPIDWDGLLLGEPDRPNSGGGDTTP
jgi:hypothetical protein